MVGVLVFAAGDSSSDEVVGLTSERFGVLVLGLGLILFCAACAMVAAWAR